LNYKQKHLHKPFIEGVSTGTLFQCVPVKFEYCGFLHARWKGTKSTERPRRRWQDSMEVDLKKQDVRMWDSSGSVWRPITGARGDRN